MKYNFVKFDGIFYRGDDRIAINKSGLVRLSAGFCRKNNIKNYKYVLLFFDKNNFIALKFIENPENGAQKVTSDRTGSTISAKYFLTKNNLKLGDIAGRYDWVREEIENIGEVYIISLNKK